MKLSLLLLLVLLVPPKDPVTSALENFRQLTSYRVTLRSQTGSATQVVRYLYKRPGFVRMEFIEPHKGAVLVYDPQKKQARLRPFGFLRPLVLTLSPDSRLITTPQGHRVDASDPGALLEVVKKLAVRGKITIMGREPVGGRDAQKVEVKGASDATVNGGVHRYLIWLDAATLLPLRVQAFDTGNRPLEDVVMDDPEINPDLPDSLFDL